MPPNPALTFADAVAVIRADDKQLVSNLKSAESKVTASVDKMQGRFDKLAVKAQAGGKAAAAASTGVSALGAAAAATGIAGLGAAAAWAQFAIQIKAAALAAKAGVAAIATLPVITTAAVAVLLAAPKAIGLIFDKLAEGRAARALEKMQHRAEAVNARLQRQTALRREIDKLRGRDVELARAGGVERGLILEKRALEREADIAKLRQRRAVEAINRAEMNIQATVERRLEKEREVRDTLAEQQRIITQQVQARVAEKERILRTFGPQTPGQASFLIAEAQRNARLTQRGLFELRRATLSQLERGLIDKVLARSLIGALPGEGGTAGEVPKRTGTVGFRRVEAFQGLSGSVTASLDKERNRVLVKVKDELIALRREVAGGGLG
jgi:hypothetical protein